MKTYVIDLSQPETERWSEVIRCEAESARSVIAEANADLESLPRVVRWMFGAAYAFFGGLYIDEIRVWAKALDVSTGTATLLNCAYELSHVSLSSGFGCTAAIRGSDELGLVHARTLDWPLPSIGQATRLFRFRGKSHEFIAVGIPGHVGILSGMVPHAYSVTVNWAPPTRLPNFQFGPAFLVRDVLENCRTFKSALSRLKRTVLSTSAFFTVCGTKAGDSCVIERTQRAAKVRPMTGTVIAQANHYLTPWFQRNNANLREPDDEDSQSFLDSSTSRLKALQRRMAELPSNFTLTDALNLLVIPPVSNDETCQRMAFCPGTGEVIVRINDGHNRFQDSQFIYRESNRT